MDSVSGPETTAAIWRRRAARGLAGAGALVLTLPISVLAQEQNTPQATGNRHFTAAPVSKPVEEETAAATTDMILGVDVNTIFFVAVGIIAVLWFTIGGGRKAKLERPQ